jgi:glycosyltransferase involved in cell wall biosynthesis
MAGHRVSLIVADTMDGDDGLGIRLDVVLSIVIPAYRQGERIRVDIENVRDVLKAITASYEIIVVVDGCPDDTLDHALECAEDRVRIFGYELNRGKGYAVRFGFHQASGSVIGFIDAGGDIDPKGLTTAVRILYETDADVVAGSKRHPQSKVTYPLLRRIYSNVYQKVVKILFDFELQDTQTGLKVFRSQVVKSALPYMSIDRFAFDVELLAIARRLGFRKFEESPVDVDLIFPSSIGGIGPVAQMIMDTARTAARIYRISQIHHH